VQISLTAFVFEENVNTLVEGGASKSYLEVAIRGNDVTTLSKDWFNQNSSGVAWSRALLEY